MVEENKGEAQRQWMEGWEDGRMGSKSKAQRGKVAGSMGQIGS